MTSRFHGLPVTRQPCRKGFTLVELLTVVGIIALLISILLPAINRARIQAKKTSSQAAVKSMSDGLEMFHNDFNRYPESMARKDPVVNWTNPEPPEGGDGAMLSGGHWLVRALMGHIFDGVDVRGLSLADGDNVQVEFNDLLAVQRQGLYLETDKFARDTDAAIFAQMGSPATGRPMFYDAFNHPIIYYRANPKAQLPFGPGSTGGIYNFQDNIAVTGSDQSPSMQGWDFAVVASTAAGIPVHPMGQFGDPTTSETIHEPPEGDIRGTTFVDTLHNHSAGQVGGVVKPVNAERFIIMSPGADGLFGTQDDVTNY